MRRSLLLVVALTAVALLAALTPQLLADDEANQLVEAMLGETPLLSDLEELTDVIGGRPTGSAANERSVAWTVERFRQAGVEARKEAFEMPELWLERTASATIEGEGVRFSPRVAAMPFSTPTPEGGMRAPLLDGGRGEEEDFQRLGEAARGALVLVETDRLEDIPGLFAEYVAASGVEDRALAAGAAGVVYQGSRPGNQLYRHNASRGIHNERPMVVMERDGASRAMRLLEEGRELTLDLELDLEIGGPYTAHNVIGEIRGSERPEEIVLLGAHLDSWGLGTGALDNGCNVALLIDVARQIRRLGLEPRRTLRFALWNGEEQGLVGSLAYTREHEEELDRHVMAASVDIGSGPIQGFFTNGRGEEVGAVLAAALEPAGRFGPFSHPDAALYGSDHFDFLLQGIAALVADQGSANYGPNYHARSDTFDKVDQEQLRRNAAVVAAVAWGFANAEIGWGRLSRDQIQAIIDAGLGDQMRAFKVMEAWESGERGRAD